MIHLLPGYMSDQILGGIVELDPSNEDDMLPAFFAYRMRRIPGTFGSICYLLLNTVIVDIKHLDRINLLRNNF